MQELDLHCQVDEDVFSWTVFLTRALVGLTLLYVAVGGLLYYREFFFDAGSDRSGAIGYTNYVGTIAAFGLVYAVSKRN